MIKNAPFIKNIVGFADFLKPVLSIALK